MRPNTRSRGGKTPLLLRKLTHHGVKRVKIPNVDIPSPLVARVRGAPGLVQGLALQVTARYNSRGALGSGDWYGVSDYAEYPTVCSVRALFAQSGTRSLQVVRPLAWPARTRGRRCAIAP